MINGFENSQFIQNNVVIELNKNYFDSERERPIETTFWYHSEDGIHPIEGMPTIVFSHGWNRNEGKKARFRKEWVRKTLIKEGYNYLAVEHPDDNVHIIKKRVEDIAFVINQLKIDDSLGEYMKTTKMGITGFSKGGATALASVGGRFRPLKVDEDEFTQYFLKADLVEILNRDQADKDLSIPGIQAAVLLQPGWIRRYTPESLKNIDVPVLILDKENEELVEQSFTQWMQENPRILKYLLPGKSHFILLDHPTEEDKNEMPLELFQELFINGMEGVDRKEVHLLSAQKIVDFFNKHLKATTEPTDSTL